MRKCAVFCAEYENDVSLELIDEMKHLKAIYKANFGDNSDSSTLNPLDLLNKFRELKVECLFQNVAVAIRIFCTIPVTVAEAERSFSKLKQIKNVQRSVMGQERLSGLALLAIESDLARSLKFDDIINDFALRKSRKIAL